jgi:histidinol phosphatase-like PHP family hydrolase
MACGVLTAQRGWARKEDIINTWTPEQLQSWLHR